MLMDLGLNFQAYTHRFNIIHDNSPFLKNPVIQEQPTWDYIIL